MLILLMVLSFYHFNLAYRYDIMANRKKRLAKETALKTKEKQLLSLLKKQKFKQKHQVKVQLNNVLQYLKLEKGYLSPEEKGFVKRLTILKARNSLGYTTILELMQSPRVNFSSLSHYKVLAKALCYIGIFRSFKTWKAPKTKDAAEIWKSLFFHLAVRFKMPKCMEIFCYDYLKGEPTRDECVALFEVLRGVGIHNVPEFKLDLNGKANFHFNHSPVRLDVYEAVWWAKFRSMGLDYSSALLLVESIEAEFLTEWKKWHSDLIFFINRHQASINAKDLRAILRFIIAQKRGHKWIILSSTDDICVPALYPDFSFKGRTVKSVLKYVHNWKIYINKSIEFGRAGNFKISTIQSFRKKCKRETIFIKQIKTISGLVKEGIDMGHCVATYSGSCLSNRISIWSLRLFLPSKKMKKLLTIEVDEADKEIMQVKGKANRLPHIHEKRWIKEWADQVGLSIYGR